MFISYYSETSILSLVIFKGHENFVILTHVGGGCIAKREMSNFIAGLF